MANALPAETMMLPIRRLVRRLDTLEFFKEDGWTQNPLEAKAFCDVVEAAEACSRHKLSGVELILRVGNGQSDVFCTPLR